MDGRAWKAAVHGVAEGWTRLSDFTFTHWRRKWQPTLVFLPGESQGQGSLVGCRLWGRTESDTTEVTQQQQRPDDSTNPRLLILAPRPGVPDILPLRPIRFTLAGVPRAHGEVPGQGRGSALDGATPESGRKAGSGTGRGQESYCAGRAEAGAPQPPAPAPRRP